MGMPFPQAKGKSLGNALWRRKIGFLFGLYQSGEVVEDGDLLGLLVPENLSPQ